VARRRTRLPGRFALSGRIGHSQRNYLRVKRQHPIVPAARPICQVTQM
jgi:hypothetical protein